MRDEQEIPSANMQSILQRLDAFQEFEILVFADEVILNDPIESWPVVDALVSFFSERFPAGKSARVREAQETVHGERRDETVDAFR